MSLYGFIDQVGPAIPAELMNRLDIMISDVLDSAATKAAARTALTSDAPLEIVNGGTGVRDLDTFPLYDGPTAAETSAGSTPTDKFYPSDRIGQSWPERYGTIVSDSTDAYAMLNKAALALSAAGGGDLMLVPGKIYRYGTALVLPENVRLYCTGSHGQPDDAGAVLKPTSGVTVGINLAGVNRRGVGIRGITMDMSLMNAGSTGILWSGVHQAEMEKVAVTGFPDSTSKGIHIRGDAASGFGSLYIRLSDLRISTDALDRGIGLVLEEVSGESVNAITILSSTFANLTDGVHCIGTGSGIMFINCNSEGNAQHGLVCNGQNTGTVVQWKGGEINSNGGWGVTSTTGDGRAVVEHTSMGSNTSGDMDTTNLDVGIRILAATAGPAWEVDGANLRTNKSLVVGDVAQTVVAADTILPLAGRVRLTAASAIIMSSNPQITDGDGNQIVTLVGTSNTNTISLVNGNGLKLRGGITLGANDSLTLMYSAGGSNDWQELARSVTPKVTTFTNADATPSVANGERFQTSGTTAITDFDDGVVGQTIKIKANANITITNNASIIKLAAAGNFAMTADDTLTLTMYDDQIWTEDSRSVN